MIHSREGILCQKLAASAFLWAARFLGPFAGPVINQHWFGADIFLSTDLVCSAREPERCWTERLWPTAQFRGRGCTQDPSHPRVQ